MAANGEFDVVLVWDISRISRDQLDLLQMFMKLNKYQVGFASLKEDMDFTGHFGKFVLQILGAIAELEWNKIQERTFEGKLTSARAGNYIYAAPCYGFKRVPNTEGKGHRLQVVSTEVALVKQIFHWYVRDQKGLAEIASILNETNVPKGKYGHPRTKGTPWSDNTIRGMLANEIYRGIFISNKRTLVSKKPKRYKDNPQSQWIITPVDRIISDTFFYLAQDRLRSGNQGARGGGHRDYMLAGKLYDPVTQKGFVGYESTKKTKNYRRKKVSAVLSPDGRAYSTISVAEKELAETVWYHIKLAVNQPERFIALHKKNTNDAKVKESLIAEKKVWMSILEKATSRIDKLQDDYYDGNVREEERNRRRSRYDKDRTNAKHKLQEIELRLQQIEKYAEACMSVERFAQSLTGNIEKASYHEKKALVQLLVERIEIYDQTEQGEVVRKAKIFFRFEPGAMSGGMPGVRTDKPHDQGNNGGFSGQSDGIGEGQRKGYYLFEFESIILRRKLRKQEAA